MTKIIASIYLHISQYKTTLFAISRQRVNRLIFPQYRFSQTSLDTDINNKFKTRASGLKGMSNRRKKIRSHKSVKNIFKTCIKMIKYNSN